MTTHAFELHPVPSTTTTIVQQFRLLAWSGRWLWLTASLIALMMLSGGIGPLVEWPRPIFVGLVAMPAGVVWSMAVWQGEPPSRRALHWSLPVSRPLSDLGRALAGAFFLVVAYVALAAVGAVWAAIDGTLPYWRLVGADPWIGYFLAPLTVYALVMPLVLWSEYRATKWFMVALLCFPPLMMLLSARGVTGPYDAFVGVMVRDELSLASAVFDPMLGQVDGDWLLATLVWLGAGTLLTVLAATWRPDDLRPPAR